MMAGMAALYLGFRSKDVESSWSDVASSPILWECGFPRSVDDEAIHFLQKMAKIDDLVMDGKVGKNA
jgi:hypothetical protein